MVVYHDILAARDRISDRLGPTPVIDDHILCDRLRRPVGLKCELFQRTGSFKPRGVLNWLFSTRAEDLHQGVITVSAGNHGLALAWACRALRIPAVVLVPEHTSDDRVEAIRNHGAEVIRQGTVSEAWARQAKLAEERDLVLVHPYDDPRIIAGQGTVGLEIINQVPNAGTLLVPVGGGGLISGVAMAARERRPDIQIIGVEPAGAPTLLSAWQAEAPVELESTDTIATSLAASRAGEHTLRLSREYVDRIVTVSDDSIRNATHHLRHDCKLNAEPGGAAALAALLDNTAIPHISERGDIVVVVSGGNAGD